MDGMCHCLSVTEVSEKSQNFPSLLFASSATYHCTCAVPECLRIILLQSTNRIEGREEADGKGKRKRQALAVVLKWPIRFKE